MATEKHLKLTGISNISWKDAINKTILEDIGLDDTPCYRIAHQVMHKIYVVRTNNNFSGNTIGQLHKDKLIEEDKD